MQSKNHYLFESGHLSDNSTASYADGILEGELSCLPEEVLIHVEECSECKNKILELSVFLRNPDSSPAAHYAQRIRFKPGQKWFEYSMRIAALFIPAALLISAYFLIYKENSSQKELISKTTADKQVREKLQLESKSSTKKTQSNLKNGKLGVINNNGNLSPRNFRVNPNLESTIGTQYRSASIQILSPRNNVRLSGDIFFSWKKSTQPILILKIINNQNEVFYNYSVSGNRFIFKQKLSPGLYYWKLENKNDLLYIGKFFIK